MWVQVYPLKYYWWMFWWWQRSEGSQGKLIIHISTHRLCIMSITITFRFLVASAVSLFCNRRISIWYTIIFSSSSLFARVHISKKLILGFLRNWFSSLPWFLIKREFDYFKIKHNEAILRNFITLCSKLVLVFHCYGYLLKTNKSIT